jgi:hypothetical protein
VAPARFLLALLPALAAVPLSSQEGAWAYKVTMEGARELTTESRAQVGGKEAQAKLKLYCMPKDEKDLHGAIGIEFTILGADKLPQFHFDDFDGPDPVIGARRLMEITVTKPTGSQVSTVTPSGSFPGLGLDVFVFSLNAMSREKHSKPREILQDLLAGGSGLGIVLTDSKDPKTKIRASFPAAGIQPNLRALLAGLP